MHSIESKNEFATKSPLFSEFLKEEGNSYYVNFKLFQLDTRFHKPIAKCELDDNEFFELNSSLNFQNSQYLINFKETGDGADAISNSLQTIEDQFEKQEHGPQNHDNILLMKYIFEKRKIMPNNDKQKREFWIYKKSTNVCDFENYFAEYLRLLFIVFSVNSENIINDLKSVGLTRDFLIKVIKIQIPTSIKKQFMNILNSCFFIEKDAFAINTVYNFEYAY